MTRVVVFGSRRWSDRAPIERRLVALPADWIIVHGACSTGADAIADRYARQLGRTVEFYPADWNRHGRAAGPIRNEYMANLPEVVLGIGFRSPGDSRGTDGMRALLEARGVSVEWYA